MPNDSEDYIGGRVEVGDSFTDRGDIVTYDLDQYAMTMDNSFYDWDISGIVPAGTTRVLVGIRISDGGIGQYVALSNEGYENFINASWIYTAVTNKTNYNEFEIPVDPDNLILSYATVAAAIDVISLYIKGWWT